MLLLLSFFLSLPFISCTNEDWSLQTTSPSPSTLTPWSSNALSGVILSNGLISRTFVTSASSSSVFATYDLTSYVDAIPVSILRGLSPESILTCEDCNTSTPMPLNAFTLIANNSAVTSSDCVFVGQGAIDSLQSCEQSCWNTTSCNAINWSPLSDCVLRTCINPLNPQLSPFEGFLVYTTLIAPQGPTISLGGLITSPSFQRSVSTGAFLNRTDLDSPGVLIPNPTSTTFTFLNYSTGPLLAPFQWTPGSRNSDPTIPWPPPGLRLEVLFYAGLETQWKGVYVKVIYEIFDGIPLLSKQIEIWGSITGGPILHSIIVDDLAVNVGFGPLAGMAYAGSSEDIPSGNPLFTGTGKLTVTTDLQYGTHANWTNDCLLPSGCDAGSTQPRISIGDDPGIAILLDGSTESWLSVRSYFLLNDDGPESGITVPLYPSSETYWGCTLGPCIPGSGTAFEGAFTERRGLTLRRFLLAVAPQVSESPLQYHLAISDSASVRSACDQMSSVGWEMLVLSYGSGFNLESSDPNYISRVASDVAYCKALNVEVGGYDLIGWTRDPGNGWSALDENGHDTGNACFASDWADFFTNAALSFAKATNVSIYETDGPYAGYSCSNVSHTHHTNTADSIQKQTRKMRATYTALRNAGIHINAPDSWFTSGINKMGIGYNEGISRLPRTESVVLYRQVAYDATYYTISSASWSFLPLTGSSSSSEYEPISQHLLEFEMALSGHLAYGVSAFLYQGTTLYDDDTGKALYIKWGTWFKTYRTLLSTGDLIHILRPNGQNVDAILHVKAGAVIPALLNVWNPTDNIITTQIIVPLYYAGLRLAGKVNCTWEPWPETPIPPSISLLVDWRGRVVVNVTVFARSMTWATFVQA